MNIYVKIFLDGKFIQYENVESLSSFSSKGSFCIKKNHLSMVATLQQSVVIKTALGSVKYDINSGLLLFKENNATLILN